jgi:hypothetical protein
MPLPAPQIPYIDPYGVLDLEELAGRPLVVTVQLESAPIRQWIHPIWRGTKANGEVADIVGSALYISGPDDLMVLLTLPGVFVEELNQGHALMSYSIQPNEDFEEGYEESMRTWCLVGTRNFPGAGINVAVIKEAHDTKFTAADVHESGLSVALAPWQAMQVGDQVTLNWRGYDPSGRLHPYTDVWPVTAGDLDQPLAMAIPKQDIRRIDGGRGELSYIIDYVGGGTTTVSPVQHFQIVAAPADRLPPLRIMEQVGATLDPSQLPDTVTFRIEPYSDVREGDVLVIYAQQGVPIGADETTPGAILADDLGPAFPVTSVRLDRSTVDSGLLECRGSSEWLLDYLDSTISISYHLARPGMALASEPLTQPVRLAMVLPPPVVEGASGSGSDSGEFKGETTGAGIKVWVPSLAVYPQNATLHMHWVGAASNGSQVVQIPTSDVPPSFIIAPSVVAPNLGKTVQVFYRVTPSDGLPQDSAIFTLKVLPIPEKFIPNLECVQADPATRTLRLSDIGNAGSTQKFAPWVLIAVGQKIDLTVTGTLRTTGLPITHDMLKDFAVTSAEVTNGITELLAKTWLNNLQRTSQLTFTVRVTADDGLTYFIVQRLYLTLLD